MIKLSMEASNSHYPYRVLRVPNLHANEMNGDSLVLMKYDDETKDNYDLRMQQ
jgi:hypothetical protein